ncbi:MAG TPA: DNA mismatch repair endonuclease MutL [Terriglobia bacterium]|nr:DNA mismatch repair endonuclease MutL [Terriglobia bacterium]
MKIRVLPDDIANRIAAGEVVERPASVVKELMENSLDAGATRIAIDVEEGGRRLVRVTDDGEGMSPEDALACFGRHATSKLYEPDDLFSIKTLGFRGEALPSIASVSRLTLETQTDGTIGTAIEVAGGKLVSQREQAFPRGTQIRVEDLFFNVPARRKFLRSESYELSQITTYCTHYALAFPEIHFLLKSASFEILAAPAAGGFRDRIFQVFGKDLLDQMVEYRKEYGRSGVKIHLFTSRPHIQKYNRNSMFFFINRRLVRDKIILHAISDAYRNILPSGTFPVVILFVTIPYEDVDVNVHPAKTEVRFKHQSFVHDAIRDSILSGLTRDKTIVPMESDAGVMSPFSAPAPQPRIPDSWSSDDPIARAPFELQPGMRMPGLGDEVPLALNFKAGESIETCGEQAEEVPAYPEFERVMSEVRPLGQLRDSFIVATDLSGLIVIDQHVAHERVLFEAYLRQKLAGKLEIQRLLIPIVVQLPPRQLVILDSIIPELAQNGFEVEPFGPKTIAIKTAPAILKAAAVEKLLVELLDGLERETQVMNIDALKKKIAASVSCHAAIKINTPLDETKMRWLLGELMKTDVPTVCPHGRPIILRYDLREILKAFKRA